MDDNIGQPDQGLEMKRYGIKTSKNKERRVTVKVESERESRK